MSYASITIIVAPYHVGIYDHRVGGGPLCILSHGIDTALEAFAPVSFINIGPVDEFEGEIGRTFEIIRRISKAVSKAAARKSFPLVLSGNCYGSTAAVAGLNKFVSSFGVLWLDAHDDLDTPSTNENGYLDAMAASMLTGTSWHALMSTVPDHVPVKVKDIIFCGVRDVSDAQRQTIEESGAGVVWGDARERVKFESKLATILEQRDLGMAHIHLDLDVLDESVGRVNEFPSAGGFMPDDLTSVMGMIPTRVHPTSLAICSFNPRLEGGNSVGKLAVQATCKLIRSMKEQGLFTGNI